MSLTEQRYLVAGMTCAHCVLAVRDEVSDVPGVDAVDVDLESGRMTVAAQRLDDDAIKRAVARAGYQVAS